MDEDWNMTIAVEPQSGRIHKISGWKDLSLFLLCYWPVRHGTAYTAAVCTLSQFYYKRIDKEHLIRAFISALHEAEIPYKFETSNMLQGKFLA